MLQFVQEPESRLIPHHTTRRSSSRHGGLFCGRSKVRSKTLYCRAQRTIPDELSISDRPIHEKRMSKNEEKSVVAPVIVVRMSGGTIVESVANVPARVIFIDDDTEGGDEESIVEVNGSKVYVTDHTIDEPDPTYVESVFREIYGERYVFGAWSHIFGVGKANERICRFVYDWLTERVIHLDIESGIRGWVPASEAERADVEDSLKNANDAALSSPEDYGLEASDELPDWAKQAEVESAASVESSSSDESQPGLRYWQVTGRIPGDDEDSVFLYQMSGKLDDELREKLVEMFAEDIYANDQPDEKSRKEARDNVFKEHGQYVFINSISSSASPITHEA